MRPVEREILEAYGIAGEWRWLDAGELTRVGDLWDFVCDGSFGEADPGYEVMADEENDVMRRIEGGAR